MPALFSHFTGRLTTLSDILSAGVQNLLQQRLTAQAADELQQLNSFLDDVNLDDKAD